MYGKVVLLNTLMVKDTRHKNVIIQKKYVFSVKEKVEFNKSEFKNTKV